MNKIIKKINIEIDGKNIELSFDEALKLYNELDSIFGNKTEYIPYPQPYPRYPWYPAEITYLDNTGKEVWIAGDGTG